MVKTHADAIADLEALKGSELDACVQQIAVPELKKGHPTGVPQRSLVAARPLPPQDHHNSKMGQVPPSSGEGEARLLERRRVDEHGEHRSPGRYRRR